MSLLLLKMIYCSFKVNKPISKQDSYFNVSCYRNKFSYIVHFSNKLKRNPPPQPKSVVKTPHPNRVIIVSSTLGKIATRNLNFATSVE